MVKKNGPSYQVVPASSTSVPQPSYRDVDVVDSGTAVGDDKTTLTSNDVLTFNKSDGTPVGPSYTYVGTADGGFIAQVKGQDYLLFTNTPIETTGTKTLNVSSGVPTPVCFLPGTQIATPEGETSVEALQHGDLVKTADGRTVAVRWVGRQTISTRFADPLRVNPICIKAGALAENVPSRDLYVSPDHAILVDDILVHASALVNGTSIVRAPAPAKTFTYYHVELADHSLLLADNVPAESFIDNVDRLAFDNWDEHEALGEESAPLVEMAYPRAKAARQVPVAIRERLAARAQALFGSLATQAA
ncbi:Hint domain-containing protein [Microvirga soli]|uniref:Hint domain-containing protein n=1 Tax=Microvirga soli TaxID=1854496 RepID=UPI00191D2D71|nr:Hint domain-containing protein [Microvirga soli]